MRFTAIFCLLDCDDCEEKTDSSSTIIIFVPVGVALLIVVIVTVALVILIMICRRRRNTKTIEKLENSETKWVHILFGLLHYIVLEILYNRNTELEETLPPIHNSPKNGNSILSTYMLYAYLLTGDNCRQEINMILLYTNLPQNWLKYSPSFCTKQLLLTHLPTSLPPVHAVGNCNLLPNSLFQN